MKALLVLSVMVLVGCAQTKTLEELEREAMQSGDWSAYEKRERQIENHEARKALKCPHGSTAVCTERLANRHCSCEARGEVVEIIERR